MTDHDIEDFLSRIKRNGYLACCDFHGNQIFVWSESRDYFHCPKENGQCPSYVRDFRWSPEVDIGWINFHLSRAFNVNEPDAQRLVEIRDAT